MKENLTTIKDIDLDLLKSLDDDSLLNICLSNKNILILCSQDEEIGYRLLGLGVDINQYFNQPTDYHKH